MNATGIETKRKRHGFIGSAARHAHLEEFAFEKAVTELEAAEKLSEKAPRITFCSGWPITNADKDDFSKLDYLTLVLEKRKRH